MKDIEEDEEKEEGEEEQIDMNPKLHFTPMKIFLISP